MQDAVKRLVGPATRAVAPLCQGERQAGQHFLGLMVAQTQAATELLGQLVTAPLRTTRIVWTQLAGFASRSAAVESVAQAAAEPAAGAAVAAVTEPPEMDQVPPELDRAGAPEDKVEVTFRLPAEVGAHAAHLSGEFNDWSTTADQMQRLDDGSFELTTVLPVGQRWHFRYLLDGSRWENDWAADDYTPNALGVDDSVVDLQTPSTSRLLTRNQPVGG